MWLREREALRSDRSGKSSYKEVYGRVANSQPASILLMFRQGKARYGAYENVHCVCSCFSMSKLSGAEFYILEPDCNAQTIPLNKHGHTCYDNMNLPQKTLEIRRTLHKISAHMQVSTDTLGTA